MPNRLSISIFLSFVAIMMAFYSGFVFSQTAPNGGAKSARSSQVSLVVTVNVLSSCNFQVGQLPLSAADRTPMVGSGFGARCSNSQPLIVSASANQAGASGSQANLQVAPGTSQLNAQTGTPFWAEATDRGLLVIF